MAMEVAFRQGVRGVCRQGLRLSALVLVGLSCAGTTGIAQAVTLTWSAPITLGGSLRALACPSTSQCSVVNAAGQEVTFDPDAPVIPSPVALDSLLAPLDSLACPSVTQCTAGGFNKAVTFNPVAPGTQIPAVIPYDTRGSFGGGVFGQAACPSVSQCTVLDTANHTGVEVTFNPLAPGAPASVEIDPSAKYYLSGLACPSTTECIAVDGGGNELTFDPGSPGGLTPTSIDTYPLTGVACPSSRQCIAPDDHGGAITFDPVSPGTRSTVMIGDGNFFRPTIVCPATTLCVAVDFRGYSTAGDPTKPGTWSSVVLPGAPELVSVACPSATRCVAVDFNGHAFVARVGSRASGRPAGVAAQPVLGRSVAASPIRGTVLFRPPGSATFMTLVSNAALGLGTELDTTHGAVRLVSATHAAPVHGDFSGGLFTLRQDRRTTVTTLVLARPACGARAAVKPHPGHRRRRVVNWVFALAHGDYTTRGRYSVAADIGTRWLTRDSCGRTLVRVLAGVVRVTDLVRHRTLDLTAGQSRTSGPRSR